jgi:hypothetical protein
MVVKHSLGVMKVLSISRVYRQSFLSSLVNFVVGDRPWRIKISITYKHLQIQDMIGYLFIIVGLPSPGWPPFYP